MRKSRRESCQYEPHHRICRALLTWNYTECWKLWSPFPPTVLSHHIIRRNRQGMPYRWELTFEGPHFQAPAAPELEQTLPAENAYLGFLENDCIWDMRNNRHEPALLLAPNRIVQRSSRRRTSECCFTPCHCTRLPACQLRSPADQKSGAPSRVEH